MNSWKLPITEKMQAEQQRRPQRGDLDAPGDPPGAGPVDGRRLVQVVRDGPQGGVQDDHVVAGELPGHDVRERAEHRGRCRGSCGAVRPSLSASCANGPKSGRRGSPTSAWRPRRAPRTGRRCPAGTALANRSSAAVDGERESQREHQHDRHLDEEELCRPAARPAEQPLVAERPGVVVQPGEDRAADRAAPGTDSGRRRRRAAATSMATNTTRNGATNR